MSQELLPEMPQRPPRVEAIPLPLADSLFDAGDNMVENFLERWGQAARASEPPPVDVTARVLARLAHPAMPAPRWTAPVRERNRLLARCAATAFIVAATVLGVVVLPGFSRSSGRSSTNSDDLLVQWVDYNRETGHARDFLEVVLQ